MGRFDPGAQHPDILGAQQPERRSGGRFGESLHYISDNGSGEIKQWDTSTQALSTLVNFVYPQAVALDAGNVYFNVNFAPETQVWNATTRIVSTIISSGLVNPSGLAVDWAGNVYVGDLNGAALYVWSPLMQTVTTLASTEVPGVAVGGSGNLYIADYWC